MSAPGHFRQACYNRMTTVDRAWLEAQGVPPMAVNGYPGPVGRTPDDQTTFVQPIYSDGRLSRVIGAVAWPMRDPSRFWIVQSIDGEILGLGQHFLLWAADERGSLGVVQTPLEWLCLYGCAFCPLTWPETVFELLHLKRIIARPASFGLELRRRLDQARPQIPRIEVAA